MRHAISKHLGDFLAILLLFTIGIGTGGYILSQQRFRFPVLEAKPFQIKAEFSDAQAVTPGQGQTVRVAGVRVGDIGGVELEEGKAVITFDLDREYENLVRRDATALLRPKTGVKDMFVELDPGNDPQRMRAGETISVANTAPDIDPDEVLSALDRDTQDYLKLLVTGAGKGLDGRGGDLQETFARLGPLHRDVARLTKAIARRRTNLRRLVHNYSSLVNELADKDGELARLVTASNSVFESLASVDQEISSSVSKLPGALRSTESALGEVEQLGRTMGPALESLRPPIRKLDEANRELLPFGRAATPAVRDQIRPFVRELRPRVRDLRPAARGLNRATPDLRESFFELNRFFNMAAYNKDGAERLTGNVQRDLARDEGYLFYVAWVAQVTTSIFNTADASGVLRRGQFTVSCDTIRETLKGEAPEALIPLIEILPVINDPALCGTSAP